MTEEEKCEKCGENSRRDFLKTAAATGVGTAILASCSPAMREKYLKRHFRELTKEELEMRFDKLEKKYSEKYGKDVDMDAKPPQVGVEFGYALDISRCIGCRKCVYACVEENNQSRDPQIHWIKVLEMEKEEGVDLTESTAYYNPNKVPEEDYFYMPVQCHQCRKPPCTNACPVEATWQQEDGVTVIDYDWCIGCRYCMAACPYGARHFNWGEPELPEEDLNPDMHYLGNRPREIGVVEKCHFCLQRSRDGEYPACVEACPVGARKFGNLLDPESEIRYILENKRVFVFKEALDTQPRFYYFYG